MFREISPSKLGGNVFDNIGKTWMLVTAGSSPDKGGFNMMTASWGGMGILWNKPVATVYIRPQRHTFGFIEREDYLSLSFFDDEKYRDMLMMCGTKSGRDCDKLALSGLTPVFDREAPYYAEASRVLICRKLYRQRFEPECFTGEKADKLYPDGDYHYMYICEITGALASAR